MITISKQISEHFHSSEFVCKHCGAIKIDENLVDKLEHIFSKLNSSKCIISSGYRCPEYDKKIGGFVGKHAEGLASDCCYYDKNNNPIPSKIVCCVAYDLGELNGIAKIDDYYVHLDNRSNSYYHGDEPRGNSSYWNNPYEYFGVSKEEVSKYTGEKIEDTKVNVHYKVKTLKHSWLPGIDNLNDYAGFENSPITCIAMRVDKGSIKYRVHIKDGSWLPYVTGYDINNFKNGYAGDGREIDLIEVYYYTPDNIRIYKKAKYKVNDYDWQYDNETSNGQDGYAGVKGVPATKFQIEII